LRQINLYALYPDRALGGEGGNIKGGWRCVCFTETPLAHLVHPLSLRDVHGNCGKVKEITIHHLQSVKDKIRDLRKLERTLTRIPNECEGGVAPHCPIIEALYSGHS
jgi:hypothetical protein